MTAEPADAELAARAIDGDRAAFARLVRRHQPAALRAVRGLGMPEPDVEDAVQDGVLAMWRSLADFDTDRAFRPWMMRIVVNRARDFLRRRRVRAFLHAAVSLVQAERIADPDPGPERVALANHELARVIAVLNKLPSGPREALVLTSLAGLSQDEAAEVLGIGVRAVEGRVARARARLAALIQNQDGE